MNLEAVGLQRRSGLVARIVGDVGDDDARPFLREDAGVARALPPRAACDEHALSGETPYGC